MERQELVINKVQKLLLDTQSMWKDLPRLADLQRTTNYTLEAVENLNKRVIKHQDEIYLIAERILENQHMFFEKTVISHEHFFNETRTMDGRAYVEMQQNYDTLRNELQKFSKNEHVMLQTADNVIAAKKRIEYGVHQISMEIGELIRVQGNLLNKSINEKFNQIESTLTANQTNALTNLSAKIESNMSQVWSQIGIMYQQLLASRTSLDKLTEQTASYVNGSATTLDNMKETVSTITTRMAEVDDNLNYLLGRLSLVTQEFTQIKTGLGDALEKAKTSFHNVKAELEDSGSGLHKTEK